MADINVERRAPSAWAWIIGLIVLALLIWIVVEIFGGTGDRDSRRYGDVDTSFVEPAAAPIPSSPLPEITPPLGTTPSGTTDTSMSGTMETMPGAVPSAVDTGGEFFTPATGTESTLPR